MDWREIFGIGVQPINLNTFQVCARAILVLLFALVLVKLAHKRFMAKKTAFEYVLGFMLASILARSINGSAPLFPSLAAGALLVGLQWIIARLACRFDSWEWLVKGRTKILIENGTVNNAALLKSDLSVEDLMEDLRLQAKTEDVAHVRLAKLERNGDISVLRHPRVILLKVESGVQFMEIRLDA